MEHGIYQKLPIDIEAFHWEGQPPQHWPAWARDHLGIRFEITCLQVDTSEGTLRANRGDWIIKGVDGGVYPCRDDIFRKTYRKVA